MPALSYASHGVCRLICDGDFEQGMDRIGTFGNSPSGWSSSRVRRGKHACGTMPFSRSLLSMYRLNQSPVDPAVRYSLDDAHSVHRPGAGTDRFRGNHGTILQLRHGQGRSRPPMPGTDPDRLHHRQVSRNGQALDHRVQSRTHLLHFRQERDGLENSHHRSMHAMRLQPLHRPVHGAFRVHKTLMAPTLTAQIKQVARDLGFDVVGISSLPASHPLTRSRRRQTASWLDYMNGCSAASTPPWPGWRATRPNGRTRAWCCQAAARSFPRDELLYQ